MNSLKKYVGTGSIHHFRENDTAQKLGGGGCQNVVIFEIEEIKKKPKMREALMKLKTKKACWFSIPTF